MNRAIWVQAKAMETLEGLMKNSPSKLSEMCVCLVAYCCFAVNFTTSDVEEWYSHELTQCTASRGMHNNMCSGC